MVRHASTKKRDHLHFLGITAKTQRCYEKSVAAFFQYSRALRGRLPATMIELDEELAEYINHSFKKEIMRSWRGGQTLASAVSSLAAASTLPPHSCCVAIGSACTSRPVRHLYLGWVLGLWLQLLRCGGLTWLFFRCWLRILLVNHGTSFSSLSPCSSFSWSRHGGYCYHQVENLQGTATVFVPARVGTGHSAVLPLDQDFPFKKKNTGFLANSRSSFSALVASIGLDPLDYLPYCPRRGKATTFISNPSLCWGRTRWKDKQTARMYVDDALATLIQLLLPSHVTTLQRHLAASGRVASQR